MSRTEAAPSRGLIRSGVMLLVASCAGAAQNAGSASVPPVTSAAPVEASSSASVVARGDASASVTRALASHGPIEDAAADTGTLALLPAPATVPDETSAMREISPSACNEQPPQDFLVRGTFLKDPSGNARAIQYRTEQYGYFKGFGHPAARAEPPSAFLQDATFFGLRVKMHRKVAPVLACVEAEIRRSCADHPYTPHALAGIRYRNTYRGGEVTNHAYGIAIDVDPARNTCCGCVPPWNDAPACKRVTKSEYDRMEMPECWVHAFERFGFYWLGHDTLKDTMHFEFLGDPSRILKRSERESDGGL